MTARIVAVTFDLWDTLVRDDSDERARAARGLRSKREERRHLVWQALARHQPIDHATVSLAYDVADAAFTAVWHDQHVTWAIEERLRVLLNGLGRTLPDDELAEVVRLHEEMELTVAPEPVPGAAATLAALARRYRLAVVSDAIVSPGRCLHRLLAAHGLAQHFAGFAFSDEVGRSKPHRAMFESAARQLGVEPAAMVHVGDREHNDVRGAHAAGLKAVLFTGARDADREGTRADAVCERFDELPAVIDRLAGGAGRRAGAPGGGR